MSRTRLNIGQQGDVRRVITSADGRLLPSPDDPSGLDRLRSQPELARLVTAAVIAHGAGLRFYSAEQGFGVYRIDVLASPGTDPRQPTTSGMPGCLVLIAHLTSLPYDLTVRELDVVTLLMGGLANKQIATALGTSVRTVTTQVERVLAKTGSPSRTSAALLAREEGLVRLPVPGGSDVLHGLPWGPVAREFATKAVSCPPTRAPLIRLRPLVVGAALPIVGSAAEDGLEMLHGTQLAVDEVNERGGVAGRPVELVMEGLDVDDPESVRRAFTALAEAGVDAMTSGYVGRQDIAHDVVADYGSPYLHAATLQAMAARVADNSRYRRIFQVCPSDVHYGPGFVRMLTHVRERYGSWTPSREVVVLQSAWPMADVGMESMARIADQTGWVVGDTLSLGEEPQQWAALAARVQAQAPAAVLISDYLLPATVGFIDEFLRAPTPTLVYALYSPSIPAFRQQLGPRAEGILWATVTGTYSDPIGQSFAQRYRSRFGVNPGRSHAGIAYDRVKILAHAWATAPHARDFSAVASEIRRTIHRGVNGAYYFTDAEQVALSYPDVTRDPSLAQAHLVYQIQEHRHRILSPAPYAEAVFQFPPWIRREG